MSTATLTSLAMLKVNIDQKRDYLHYLNPFILHILADHKLERVTDSVVKGHLLSQFGLEIPSPIVQIVLRRLARSHKLHKERNAYTISGKLRGPSIHVKKADAERHIQAVASDLVEFSKTSARPLSSIDEAVVAICTFLEQFNISCLRAYLRGTALPRIRSQNRGLLVLVSDYVRHLQNTHPERFKSFSVIVEGHMLANALLCPDLASIPPTYRDVTFYLDTPLLVQRLGLESDLKKDAMVELMRLVRTLGGKIATFAHSRDELYGVIVGAANNLDFPNSRLGVAVEARRRGSTSSDLILIAERVEDKLSQLGIEVVPTPKYKSKFQISEEEFEDALEDELTYANPRAKYHDINSVRSIYALREGRSPHHLEKAVAVLVTSNAAFARAAWNYGQKYDESREVSSVITNFSLANIAWLKAPLGAPAIPTSELLAFSHAALQPSTELMEKYLTEIDRLEKSGKISARDHQLLRSSLQAHDELVNLTLGDEAALTEETIVETLDRVSSEIKREENEKLVIEQQSHQKTREVLRKSRREAQRIREHIYWRSRRQAKQCKNGVAALLALLLMADLLASLAFFQTGPSNSALVASPLILAVGTFAILSRWYGITVREMLQRFENMLFVWLLKRSAASTGIKMEDFSLT